MIQVAICDDEENIRGYLKKLILEQNTDCEVVEYQSAEEFLQSKKEYDLMYLDIELDTEVSGLELAKKIRKKNSKKQPLIIFVTGYREYVFDVFDLDAFHYLLKPILKEKFIEIFQRAIKRLECRDGREENMIYIQSPTLNKIISSEEIDYAESQNHKVILHTKSGVLEYYGKISDLEAQLQGQFFRIHKGYLVNMSYIDSYTKCEVKLCNHDVLPLSKYKYTDFVKAYLRFME